MTIPSSTSQPSPLFPNLEARWFYLTHYWTNLTANSSPINSRWNQYVNGWYDRMTKRYGVWNGNNKTDNRDDRGNRTDSRGNRTDSMDDRANRTDDRNNYRDRGSNILFNSINHNNTINNISQQLNQTVWKFKSLFTNPYNVSEQSIQSIKSPPSKQPTHSTSTTNSYPILTISFLSALSHWVSDILFFPIDTISTRLKAQQTIFARTHPKGLWQYVIGQVKRQKWGIYRGVGMTFGGSFLPIFLYVSLYESIMRSIQLNLTSHSLPSVLKLIFPFFISGMCQFTTLALQLPIDTVRTRVQMNIKQYSYRSFIGGIRQIQQKQGFSRLYKSAKLYFVCKTLYTAVQFQVFQVVRYSLGPSLNVMLFNTLLSTCVATTLLNPLQVLLTRYALVDTTKNKLVFFHMVQTIYKKQGLRGFYKGYITQLILHCLFALSYLPVFQWARQKYGVQLIE